MSQRLPITPSPSSGPHSRLMISIIVIGLVITAVLIGCMVWCCLKGEVLEEKEEVLAPSSISPILLFLLACL